MVRYVTTRVVHCNHRNMHYRVRVSCCAKIWLVMRLHHEGQEQLVVQPYYLRETNKYGLLVDFHFRLNKGVPYTRQVQQLSLSLDRNYRRNLDYYADRVKKIKSFIEERWNFLSSITLPGAKTPSRVSKDFISLPARRLGARTYIFARNLEAKSQYTGLKDFGPLQGLPQAPKLLFAFREEDRVAARKLAIALQGSKDKERYSFPGFNSLFKSPLIIDPNPFILTDLSDQSIQLAVERIKNESVPTLAIFVIPDDEDGAYFYQKSLLTKEGIASQTCTLKVINDENALKWAIANIALQVFCKLGGYPWKVKPMDGESLIIGISQSHKTLIKGDKPVIDRYFSFSILTDSSGLFQRISVLGNSGDENIYLSQLSKTLENILASNVNRYTRIVIHTSFRLKVKEIDAIQNVVEKEASKTTSGDCRFAVVKVNQNSNFFGYNPTVNSLVPYEGAFTKLSKGGVFSLV